MTISRDNSGIDDRLSTMHRQVRLSWDGDTSIWEKTDTVDGRPTGLCADCGLDTTPKDGFWEWYMVKSRIWEAAMREGPEAHYLCIGCLEQRLRRELTAADFSDHLCNQANSIDSRRLTERRRVSET
jgi:hypothetical protein